MLPTLELKKTKSWEEIHAFKPQDINDALPHITVNVGFDLSPLLLLLH